MDILKIDISPTPSPPVAAAVSSSMITSSHDTITTSIPNTSANTNTNTNTNLYSNPQKTVWIRVPRQDARAVVSALSSWVGVNNTGGAGGGGNVAWRICAKGNFLGALIAGSGGDLFIPP